MKILSTYKRIKARKGGHQTNEHIHSIQFEKIFALKKEDWLTVNQNWAFYKAFVKNEVLKIILPFYIRTPRVHLNHF